MDAGGLTYMRHARSAATMCPYTSELVWVCLACGELEQYQHTGDCSESHDEFMAGIADAYGLSRGGVRDAAAAAVHSPSSGAEGTVSGALTSSCLSSPATPTPPPHTTARLGDACLRATSDSYLSQAASSSHQRHQQHRRKHAAAPAQLLDDSLYPDANSEVVAGSRDSSSQRHAQHHSNSIAAAATPTATGQPLSSSLNKQAVDSASFHSGSHRAPAAAPSARHKQQPPPAPSRSSRHDNDDAAMHSLTVLLMEEHLIGSREMRFCRHCLDVRCAEIRKLSELPHPDALDGDGTADMYAAGDLAQVSFAATTAREGRAGTSAAASSPAHQQQRQQQQRCDDALSLSCYTPVSGLRTESRSNGSFLSPTHHTTNRPGNSDRRAATGAAPDATSALLYDAQDTQPLDAWFADRAQPPSASSARLAGAVDGRLCASEEEQGQGDEEEDAGGVHGAPDSAEGHDRPRHDVSHHHHHHHHRRSCRDEIPSVHRVVALSLSRLLVQVKSLAAATTSLGLRLLAPATAALLPSDDRRDSNNRNETGGHLYHSAVAGGRGRHTSSDNVTAAPAPVRSSGWLAVLGGLGHDAAAAPHDSREACVHASGADDAGHGTAPFWTKTSSASEAVSGTPTTGGHTGSAAHARRALSPAASAARSFVHRGSLLPAQEAATPRANCAVGAQALGTTGGLTSDESNGVSFTSSGQPSYAMITQDIHEGVDGVVARDRPYRAEAQDDLRLKPCDALRDNAAGCEESDASDQLEGEDDHAHVGDIDDHLDALANRHGLRLGHTSSVAKAAAVQASKHKWDVFSVGEALWRLILPSFSAPFSSTPSAPFSRSVVATGDVEGATSRHVARRSPDDRRGYLADAQTSTRTTDLCSSSPPRRYVGFRGEVEEAVGQLDAMQLEVARLRLQQVLTAVTAEQKRRGVQSMPQ